MIRIAINGYGRIGRDLHRQTLPKHSGIEVVAINSRADAFSHAYLLKHDTLYGSLDAEIFAKDAKTLVVNGKEIPAFQEQHLSNLNWREHKVDIVIESTGHFAESEHAQKHLNVGASKVLITAPCKDDTVTIVMGVNEKKYRPKDHQIISNASCTTNALAPLAKVIHEHYEIEHCFVSTIHALTYSQNLLDNSGENFRRSRSVFDNIIPTTTGAMRAISKIMPELQGKIDGMAFRVPIPTVSVIDAVFTVKKKVMTEEVNERLKEAERGSLKGILGTTNEELVSSDFIGDTRSTIIDLSLTKAMNNHYVKVIAWYDNEWGYVARITDLIRWMGDEP